MKHAREHREVVSLLGAFALDAVPDEERARIDRHLERCRLCSLEIELHRETATLLVSASLPPPGALWRRISSGLATATPRRAG